MAYAVSYEVPGNEEIYGKVKAEIGNDRPQGLIVHLVVQREAGLQHIEVWESEESWVRFRDEEAQPAVNRFLKSIGFDDPAPAPAEEEIQVVDVMLGQAKT